MYLPPITFYPLLIKGEILQNCHVLIEQSFHSAFSRDEDFKHHTFKPGDFISWKRHLQKDSFQPH